MDKPVDEAMVTILRRLDEIMPALQPLEGIAQELRLLRQSLELSAGR
jgi:hypothetical protein